MAKSSKIYWAARQRQLNKALQKAEKDLTKRLSAFYLKESAKLDKEIAAYYAELGEDNVIEYRKMLQHMSDADRKLLMERMEDFAKKYPGRAHLMPTRASIYKLDRLEGLQTSTKLHQMEIGAMTEEEVTKHLKQTAVRSANAAAEALAGKGGSLYELNSPLVEKIVGTNWANGISYSERIWKNTEKLADKLNSDISAGFVRGDSYDKLSKQLMTEMNIRNRSDAERLIYTEGTHVMNEASISVFQEAGFDQYIISPLPDACEYCQEIASEQNALVERERSGVPISERVAGENFPPLHPWCRCSYEIYIEGMQRDDSVKMPENVEKHENESKKHARFIRQFKDGEDMRQYIAAEYWIGTEKDFAELNTDIVYDTTKGYEQVREQYPIIKDTVKGFEVCPNQGGPLGFDPVTERLCFDKEKYTNREVLNDTIKEQIEMKNWIEGASAESLAAHEAGHMYEWELIKLNPEYVTVEERLVAWDSCRESGTIVAIAEERLAARGVDLSNISMLAERNDSEKMAEAFHECYIKGDNASAYSKEIVDVAQGMERYYAGIRR